jgi:hypothetical protein
VVKSTHPKAFSDKIWVRRTTRKVHLLSKMSAIIVV